MFGDSLKEMHGKKKARWAVVVSFCLQMLGVGVMVLIPLLDYYELPAAELMTFLVAPPPPPPPPPPMALVQKVIPREFDAGTLTQPTEIPDQVAIIQEADIPAATIAGVVGGVPGGTVGGQLGGIIGGIISNVPLVAPPPPRWSRRLRRRRRREFESAAVCRKPGWRNKCSRGILRWRVRRGYREPSSSPPLLPRTAWCRN